MVREPWVGSDQSSSWQLYTRKHTHAYTYVHNLNVYLCYALKNTTLYRWTLTSKYHRASANEPVQPVEDCTITVLWVWTYHCQDNLYTHARQTFLSQTYTYHSCMWAPDALHVPYLHWWPSKLPWRFPEVGEHCPRDLASTTTHRYGNVL